MFAWCLLYDQFMWAPIVGYGVKGWYYHSWWSWGQKRHWRKKWTGLCSSLFWYVMGLLFVILYFFFFIFFTGNEKGGGAAFVFFFFFLNNLIFGILFLWQLRSSIQLSTSDYDKEKLEERLAKLSGGVAVLKVSFLFEDAYCGFCSSYTKLYCNFCSFLPVVLNGILTSGTLCKLFDIAMCSILRHSLLKLCTNEIGFL